MFESELFNTYLTVLGLAWGIVSTLVAIYLQKKREKERKTRQQILRWEDLQVSTLKLKSWLDKNNYIPDVAITVPGGSVIMAGILQLEYGNKPVNVFIPEYENASRFKSPNYLKVKSTKWEYLLTKDLLSYKDKKIIVPVVYTNSGSTLRALRDGLLELGFHREDFKLVTLFNVKGNESIKEDLDYIGADFDSSDLFFSWGQHISRKFRLLRNRIN